VAATAFDPSVLTRHSRFLPVARRRRSSRFPRPADCSPRHRAEATGFEQGRGRGLAERGRVSSFNEAAANSPRKEDGGYVVTFPDFGIGVTQGENCDEALVQAVDLLETMVANYMAEGWELPEASPARGRPLVRLAPLVAAKAEVFRAMRCAVIDKVELARRLGVAPKDV
jgi:antitoxin HicB